MIECDFMSCEWNAMAILKYFIESWVYFCKIWKLWDFNFWNAIHMKNHHCIFCLPACCTGLLHQSIWFASWETIFQIQLESRNILQSNSKIFGEECIWIRNAHLYLYFFLLCFCFESRKFHGFATMRNDCYYYCNLMKFRRRGWVIIVLYVPLCTLFWILKSYSGFEIFDTHCLNEIK